MNFKQLREIRKRAEGLIKMVTANIYIVSCFIFYFTYNFISILHLDNGFPFSKSYTCRANDARLSRGGAWRRQREQTSSFAKNLNFKKS